MWPGLLSSQDLDPPNNRVIKMHDGGGVPRRPLSRRVCGKANLAYADRLQKRLGPVLAIVKGCGLQV